MDEKMETAMQRLENAQLCVARAASELVELGECDDPELRTACAEWKQATEAFLEIVAEAGE
jgi:hypothetical protein